MIEIIPAILPKSFAELEEKLALVKGKTKTVQIDVCDGKFVPSKTWPYDGDPGNHFKKILTSARPFPFSRDLNFEFDLMVSEPEKDAPNFAKFGAARLVIHLDSLKNPIADFGKLRASLQKTIQLGLAIFPDISLKRLDGLVETADFIQVMGIKRIGYQGQQFDEKATEQIAALRCLHKNLTISVDGGVNFESVRRVRAAGANRLVVGSSIFNDPEGAAAALEKFRTL